MFRSVSFEVGKPNEGLKEPEKREKAEETSVTFAADEKVSECACTQAAAAKKRENKIKATENRKQTKK